MRVGLTSYPMLFELQGGLMVQVQETLKALREIGVEADYFQPSVHRLEDFSVLHVFAVFNGNNRILEAAREAGIPTVLSAILGGGFTRRDRWVCEFLDRILGRVVDWGYSTTYKQHRLGLDAASHIVALGTEERNAIINGYEQDASKVSIIPNGVGDRFFTATGQQFDKEFSSEAPVIACVAEVFGWKNQLTAAKAVSAMDAELWLFGPCAPRNKEYLEQTIAAGAGKVKYGGSIPYDSPLLPSVYAKAQIMLLPSVSEVMPISVIEALACGTPVVMTRKHSLDISPVPGILEMVDPMNVDVIRRTCASILENPPEPEKVRELVAQYTWRFVAEELRAVYEGLLAD